MTEGDSLLEVHRVSKRYGGVVALRSAELSVERGEIHALLGANGAGKSTLVKVLSGVVTPDSGEMTMSGAPYSPGGPVGAMDAGLATVFQDPALIPHLSVEHNFRLTGVDASSVREWLETMGLGDFDFGLLISELPLPVLRLLDLARALAHEPDLLILDEITAALPADQAERVFEVMGEWRERGRSVLFITHRLREVLRMCDRATILRDGSYVDTLAPSDGGESYLVAAMLGEEVAEAELAESQVTDDAPVLLEAVDLSWPGDLDGVSFQLKAGEVLGLVALEGQGQTRLFDVLAGDKPAGSGQILVGGGRVRPRSPFDAIREGMVLVPADRHSALLPQRSVQENLASSLYNRIGRWFGLDRKEEEKVGDVIERLAIDTRAQSQAQRLSGGNQQKLTVGRWLTAGFKVMLCFDPTRGIDVGTKDEIYTLMRELASEGAAILYYTSELAEIPLLCDRVMVMYAGKIVHEQPGATADEATMLEAAHGLADELA